MATITAALVKELRESTGAGMMDCKAALTENDGDIEAAVDWLRKRVCPRPPRRPGASPPKSGRGFDRRARRRRRRSQFRDRFRRPQRGFPDPGAQYRGVALSSGKTDVDELGKQAYPAGGAVADAVTTASPISAKTSRCAALPGSRSRTACRPLCAYADFGWSWQDRGHRRARIQGRQGSSRDAGAPTRHACRIRQSAGADRRRTRRGDGRAREEPFGREERRQAAHVLEKIIESGLKTYYKEVLLPEQVSNHPDHAGKTVAQAVKETEGKAGAPIAIKGFVRYALARHREGDGRFRRRSRSRRQGLTPRRQPRAFIGERTLDASRAAAARARPLYEEGAKTPESP